MSYTEVRAPVDGTILIANQAVGSIGTQTQPVAVLADLSNQVVRLKVPEKYFDLFTMERKNLFVEVIRPAEQGMYEDAVTTLLLTDRTLSLLTRSVQQTVLSTSLLLQSLR